MWIQNSLNSFMIFFVASLLAIPISAQATGELDSRVERAWVRATVPGQKVAGAYMDITVPAGATLISASSPYAAKVELHRTTMDAGVMKMRALEKLSLPAGQTVSLKPGGVHLMLTGLTRSLNAGDLVPITLTVVDANGRPSALKVDAQARAGGTDTRSGHAGHAGH